MRKRGRDCKRLLDEWHGTIARYTGFFLLVYSAAVDRFKNPGLLPAAVALIYLKNITGRNGGRDDYRDGEGGD